MTPPPSDPRNRGARFDDAVDQFEARAERWQRLRTTFPGLIKVLLIIGLGLLAWLATYEGMMELIVANTGEVGIVKRIAIAFAVAMLMLMIIYLLDALFSPISWWLRSLYIFGYVFLTLISVGFGFGFYWKFLESRSEATRSAEASVGQVQGALETGKVRLAQLEQTLGTLTTISQQKAVEEREQGGTCPDSPPGDGPRRRLRDADAKNFAFNAEFIKSRSGAIQKDIDDLRGDLAKVIARDPSTLDAAGTRNSFMRDLDRKLDLTITRFNALKSDPQLTEMRNGLQARAQQTVFASGSGGTFVCPDPQLQGALNGVVTALSTLPDIDKADIAAVEGSEAVVEAFRRLITTSVGLLSFELPPGPEELRALQREAIQSANRPQNEKQEVMAREPGLGTRDYIPLAIAIFVDFCILLVAINRPMNRFHHLMSVVRNAKDGPVGEIMTRFHDTHLAGLRTEFEIFQHVVFDFLGDYYVAVPIGAPRTDARYLTNLFVGLEDKGIVDRVLLPPAFIVKRKLAAQNSDFADEEAFRLYRFRKGAYSKLVLDAILGSKGPDAPDDARAEPPVADASLPVRSDRPSPVIELPAPGRRARD